ncbi:sulfurtransferase-like selenium metabolism protein YedF [Clostridium gasigenes]|uniref:Sulfurtransferase-like selenium metabolism protein YedF n=1 Tax=Clostridium gasigenes TaxID=94869 RepID=A0A7X0VS79_9CLOT|nr:sulfurtransferase-like selenium metabolism protein YedF [Clostridium gasigenes]MBB6715683.1 sulfurtransferase-like selenium metabolism protein YedF [Clostridium gasigenes]
MKNINCRELSTPQLAVEVIEEKIKAANNNKNDLTIVVASNLLGEGDSNLGELLMKSYIYSLSESVNLPDNLIFINSGVKLTCQGSKVIDSLTSMKEKGVNILDCGTCLDFYGLKEKLLVGDVGNMYLIVQLMNESKNTIKI